MLVKVAAAAQGEVNWHHQWNSLHFGQRHPRHDGPVRAYWKVSLIFFSIVRSRRNTARRGVLSPIPFSADFQPDLATHLTVWAKVYLLSPRPLHASQHG